MSQAFEVPTDGGGVLVRRWGADPELPVALLVHGTGFCGSVWQGVVDALLDAFVVCAIDRRGHGGSAKPTDAYDFADFADDAVRVVDALDLHDAYAIGHSAGATDLLIAAARRPHAFRRIVAIEPTVIDPVDPARRPERDELHAEQLGGILRRRTTFASRAAVFQRYRTRDAFADWRADLLEAYVRDGFRELDDGSVTLQCTPEIERSMLTRIFAVMEGAYRGDHRGNPFEALAMIRCPTLIATTERSQPVYRQMAEVARRVVPRSVGHHFDHVGHSVAQVRPDAVARVARRFWDDDGSFGPSGEPTA